MVLICVALMTVMTWAAEPVDKKYLAGAVPEVNGAVVWEKTYTVEGRSTEEIYNAARTYVLNELVNGPEHGTQARITQDSPEEGLLAASIQETMWFLRKPMRSDFAQCYYQVVVEVKDSSVTATLRNFRYLYDINGREQDILSYRAEEWITDREAISKNGTKLARVNGKFRCATIDRKDSIFRSLGQAIGAKAQTKTIVVEEY